MQYRIQNKRIELFDYQNKNYYDFSEEFYIKRVCTNLLSNEQKVVICIVKPEGEVYCELARSALDKNVLSRLLQYGLSVVDTAKNNAIVLKILFDSESEAEHVYRHSQLGFCRIQGQPAFLAYRPIGLLNDLKARSRYENAKKVRPKGSYEAWQGLMRREVIGNPNLELALALGAVAPIAHVLMEENVLSLIPIFALIGKSSTGKTTSLKMIASIYGSPNESSGIISDLNSTQNAFFAQLNSHLGVLALIDETSSSPEWDFGKTLYNLPKGREKLRCDSNGKLKQSETYTGSVIFTGEHSLFKQCRCSDDDSGVRARLLEFDLPWTNNAGHAMRLDRGCCFNYGIAVGPLAAWVLENRKDIKKAFKKQYQKLKEELSDEVPISAGITDRIIKTYSLILLSASVIRVALKLDMNITAIKKVLVQHFRTNYCGAGEEKSDDIDRLYDFIKASILDKKANFPSKESAPYSNSIWGVCGSKLGTQCVWIIDSKFKEFLNEGKEKIGVESKTDREILRLLHERRYIDKPAADRYCKTEKICGAEMKCYCIFFPLTTAVSLQTKQSVKSVAKMSPKIRSLLADSSTKCS